ncbi:Predicted arabinose efflux permease, MFS family [Lentibacillus halodurans]|uniref:Predicted arabinose efflux permease, MFS family n=1 Tax=Lentibacillus halodurans TaxID=237679 RepID=A0A1I0Y1B5_9BACI|nr:MFS transporter [Lentibacillus halodurans]SFB06964.1 Predicted arabinose efflux permease, MFS family [Lentibacillus halodurans]
MSNWTVWKQEKNYRKLFWAGAISGIGSRFTQVAILTLLYQITDSGLAIGIFFTVRMAPFLLVAPLGGMLADRMPKKNLLIITDILRVPFALSPLLVQGPDHLWIIYTSAFFLASGDALYSPVRMASIPALVKQDRLLYVNAIEQIMLGAVLVVGSSTGGIIAYLFGLSVPFTLDGISFMISAMFLTGLTIPVTEKPIKQMKPIQHEPSNWNYILSSAALIIFLVIELTMPLANGTDNVLMSVYALDVFEMDDLGVGFIYGALGLGFIISSFFSNMLKRKLVPLIVIFIALEGTGHLILSSVPTFYIALLTVLFITFVGGISNICLSTLTMKVVPRSKQGSFFGLTEMISNTTMGVAMGVAGVLLKIFEPRTLSFLVGITYIVFTVVYAILFSKIDLVKAKRELRRA